MISLRKIALALAVLMCASLFSCEKNPGKQNESSISDTQSYIEQTGEEKGYPGSSISIDYYYPSMLIVSCERKKAFNVSQYITFEVKFGTHMSNTILKPNYAVLEVREALGNYPLIFPDALTAMPGVEYDYRTETALLRSFQFDNYMDYPEWDYITAENGKTELVTPLTVNVTLRGDQLSSLSGNLYFLLLVYDENDTNIGVYNMQFQIAYKIEGTKIFLS